MNMRTQFQFFWPPVRPGLLVAGALVASLLGSAIQARAELPGGIRVTAAVEPERLRPGDDAKLAVTVHLPSGWIIYDVEQVPQSVLPTKLEIDEPQDIALLENFKSTGAKEDIEPKFGSRVARFFDRTPRFIRPISVSRSARLGEHVLRGHIGFLAQHRPSKRFYVISKALFSASAFVDLPPPPATTDEKPIDTAKESAIDQVAVTKLLEADRPRVVAPVPDFRIAIESSTGGNKKGDEFSWSMNGALIALGATVLGFVLKLVMLT